MLRRRLVLLVSETRPRRISGMCFGSGAPASVEMKEPDLASLRSESDGANLKPKYLDRQVAKRRTSLLNPVNPDV